MLVRTFYTGLNFMLHNTAHVSVLTGQVQKPAKATATTLATNSSMQRLKPFAGMLVTALFCSSILSSGAVAVSGSGLAADDDSYDAAFFEQYAPQDAMDMINRLPGFSFDRGQRVRGFGGAAGNVLIDGERPASKSISLRDALRRIPAAYVDRIEIIRGGAGAGEAAGQSIVANVIRKKGAASGYASLFIRRAPDGSLRPAGNITLSSSIGEWATTFTVKAGIMPGNRSAVLVERDSSGNLLRTDSEDRIENDKWFVLTAEGSRPMAGGKLTLNSRFNTDRNKISNIRTGFDLRFPDSGAPDSIFDLNEKDSGSNGEFGVDWTKTYSDNWKWRVIGLGYLSDQTYRSVSLFEDFTEDTRDTDEFIQNTKTSEFILRTTYSKQGTAKLRPEFGVEFASNRNDSTTSYTENDVLVDLSAGSVLVEELRGEAFASLIYQVSPKLLLNGRVTGEVSRIKVTGDATAQQTLTYLKPAISATYGFAPNLKLIVEAKRVIGQLSFSDFSATSDAQDDRQNAGNPNLRPDAKTRLSSILDWKFSARGNLQVEAFHEWRSDILENIILPSGGEGIGNAGNARLWGFEAKTTIPLDRYLDGAQIEVEYTYQRSTFRDPVIDLQNRQINQHQNSWFNVNFRHDIPNAKVSWGVDYEGAFRSNSFYVSERGSFKGNGRFEAFVETTRYFGMKIRLKVRNINTGNYTRSRFIFVGDRSGLLDQTIIASRKRKPTFRIEMTKSF